MDGLTSGCSGKPLSGCERVLAALRSGPKTASELYALNVVVHSRVAELRKQGYRIVCERAPKGDGPGAFTYRLLEDPSAAESGNRGWSPNGTGGSSSSTAADASAGHGAQGDPATPWTGHETPRLDGALSCCSAVGLLSEAACARAVSLSSPPARLATDAADLLRSAPVTGCSTRRDGSIGSQDAADPYAEGRALVADMGISTLAVSSADGRIEPTTIPGQLSFAVTA